VLLASSLTANAAPARAQLAWNPNMSSAVNQAGQSGEPLMMDVYNDSSAKSSQLDTVTFADPTVQRLASRFVVVRVDGGDPRNSGVNDQFHVTGYPTVIFLNVKNHKILNELGYVDAPTLCQAMQRVLDENSLLDGGSQQPAPQAMQNQPQMPAQPMGAQPVGAPQLAYQPRQQPSAGEIVRRTSSATLGHSTNQSGVQPVQDGIFLLDDSGVQRLDAPTPAKTATAPAKPLPAAIVAGEKPSAKAVPAKTPAKASSTKAEVKKPVPATGGGVWTPQ